jgi:UDP-N-acetylmuramoyl-tripeptide--D-alanyl-D-alanine ligase
VRNALAAIACTLAAGIDIDTIVRGLEAFAPVGGRLQKHVAANGAVVIDDSYNANPDSVRAAIDVLADEPAPRLLVLGDMGEVGSQGDEFHREVGAYARERGIERLAAVGEMARQSVAAFGDGAVHFESVEALNQALHQSLNQSPNQSLDQAPGESPAGSPACASVLVKGSRFMKMERVVKALAAGAAVTGAAH